MLRKFLEMPCTWAKDCGAFLILCTYLAVDSVLPCFVDSVDSVRQFRPVNQNAEHDDDGEERTYGR